MKYKILIVSLPGSPKREVMHKRMQAQNLPWEWVDGVKINSMGEIPLEERKGLEAYRVPRLKDAPEYVCRAIGCKRAMRKAIEQAENYSEDWVIIFQDDAVLVLDFHQRIKTLLSSVPEEAEAVMLNRSGSGVSKGDQWPRVVGNARSMAAFAIRPSFAPAMASALAQWHGEADRIWEILAHHGAYIISPATMLVSSNQKGSDIIGGIPELKRLWQ